MDLEPVVPLAPTHPDLVTGERPSIEVSADCAGIRLEVHGHLDNATAELLAALLRSAEEVDADVVAVDVRDVTGFTEQGVGVLAACLARTSNGPKVRYRAGSKCATRLLLAAAGARAGSS